MKELKAIFIDIDGTLINDDKVVSDFTVNEIKRIDNEYKVRFFLVSSRMPKSISKVYSNLGISGGIVAYNGAIINYNDQKFRHSEAISSLIDITLFEKYLFQLAKNEEVSVNLYKDDIWISSNLNYWTQREIKSNAINPDSVGINSELFSNFSNKLHKILIRAEANILLDVYSKLNQLSAHHHNVLMAKPTLVEITSKDINKGVALKLINDSLNIKRSEVIAFGDGENDIEMISYAGIGIAVANCTPKLKLVADEFTNSNNEDGVGNSLRKYFPTR